MARIVMRKIGVIIGDKVIDCGVYRRREIREPSRFRRRHNQRIVLGAQGVIGGDDARLAVTAQLGAAHIIEDRRAGAEFEDKALIGPGLDR